MNYDPTKPTYDLEGKIFGEFTVLYRTRSSPKKGSYWMCRCSCGAEVEKLSRSIRNGKMDRCAECSKKKTREKNEKERIEKERKRLEEKMSYNLSGKQIKNWTVVGPIKENDFRGEYLCRCKCGNTVKHFHSTLKNKKINDCCVSCIGKRQRQLTKEENKKKIEGVKESGVFLCRTCEKEKGLNEINKSDLKKAWFECRDCRNIYLEERKDKVKNEHYKNGWAVCGTCNEKKAIAKFFDSSLFLKNPHCRKCQKIKIQKDFNKNKERNLKRDSIKCCICKEKKGINEYVDSQLNNQNPKCRDCFWLDRRSYLKDKYKKDPIFREKEKIGNRIRKSLTNKGFAKNGTAAEYLGCTKDEFVQHIESQFRDGMSWENRSEWHIDHITPLATATTSEEIKELWHYTNLQPLWGHENEAKGANLDWDLEEYIKELNREEDS